MFKAQTQGSKTLKIQPKNGRISTVLGRIYIKPPQTNTFGPEGNFRGGLIKNILKKK